MCQSMEVCIRAWKCVRELNYVSEYGSVYKSVEVCVRAWKFVSERGSVLESVEVC